MNELERLLTWKHYFFMRRKRQFEEWVEKNWHNLDTAVYNALAKRFDELYIEPLNELQEEINEDGKEICSRNNR